MRIEAFIVCVGTKYTGLGKLNRPNNGVQCNTPLSKNYVAHSILYLRTKSLPALSVCLCIPYEINHGTRIFPRIHIRQQGA